MRCRQRQDCTLSCRLAEKVLRPWPCCMQRLYIATCRRRVRQQCMRLYCTQQQQQSAVLVASTALSSPQLRPEAAAPPAQPRQRRPPSSTMIPAAEHAACAAAVTCEDDAQRHTLGCTHADARKPATLVQAPRAAPAAQPAAAPVQAAQAVRSQAAGTGHRALIP